VATFDRMYGALEVGKLGKPGEVMVIHLRHPITPGLIMCGLAGALVFPIGSVPGDDPALHPECRDAWREARKAVQPADTVRSV
jgi:hypothetical protein